MLFEEFTWNYADQSWYGPDLDPEDEVDYTIDFVDVLGTDTISSVQITSSNVTVSTSSNTTTAVTAWLVAGIRNQVGLVTIHITTVGGRQLTQSFKVNIKDL